MTEDTIPVPAESLRTLAEHNTDAIRQSRADGYDASARRIEEAVGEAFSSLEGKDGEFVSIDPTIVSTLCAHADYSAEIVWKHSDAAEVFLEKYGIWGDE